MNRRSFLGLLAGLFAAPLIAKPEDPLLKADTMSMERIIEMGQRLRFSGGCVEIDGWAIYRYTLPEMVDS